MCKSALTWFLDIVRHLLIITGTVAVLYLSRTRVHWLLLTVLATPVYVVIFCLLDLLMLPLYFLTPEHKVVSMVLKAIEEGDFTTASRVLEAYEKRHWVESQDGPHAATTEADDRQNEFVAVWDDRFLRDSSGFCCDDEESQTELVGSTLNQAE